MYIYKYANSIHWLIMITIAFSYGGFQNMPEKTDPNTSLSLSSSKLYQKNRSLRGEKNERKEATRKNKSIYKTNK